MHAQYGPINITFNKFVYSSVSLLMMALSAKVTNQTWACSYTFDVWKYTKVKIRVRTEFKIYTSSSGKMKPFLTPYFSTFGHLPIPTLQPYSLSHNSYQEGVKATMYFLLPMLGNSVAQWSPTLFLYIYLNLPIVYLYLPVYLSNHNCANLTI